MTAQAVAKRRTPARRQAGFSLVELLVATGVSMLMLTLLMTVFSGSLQSWSTTAARSETFGEARAALNLLERELRQIVRQPEGLTAPLPVVVSDLEAPTGETDEALAFLCKVRQDGQPSAVADSDICAVSYFLAPESAAANAPLALFRRLTPSEQTYEKLTGTGADVFDEACQVDELAEVVAQNVIHFEVQLRDKDLNLLPRTSPDVNAAAYVETVLKVISTQAAQAYFAPAISTAQQEQIARREAREFTLRHTLH